MAVLAGIAVDPWSADTARTVPVSLVMTTHQCVGVTAAVVLVRKRRR